jgi:hypothetical protein
MGYFYRPSLTKLIGFGWDSQGGMYQSNPAIFGIAGLCKFSSRFLCNFRQALNQAIGDGKFIASRHIKWREFLSNVNG